MTKKDKVNEVLTKIKKDKIQPVPKWQCKLVDVTFWAAVIIAVLLSSVFFSFLLIGLFEIPVDIFRELHIGRYIKIILQAMPYAWVLLVLTSLFLGVVAFQKTRHGYRYKFVVIISILMTIVLFLGFFFRQKHIGRPIQELAESRSDYFRGGPFNKAQNEVLVEDGLLGGEVVNINKNRIVVKNLFEEEWTVLVSNETRIKRDDPPKQGDKILIIGEEQERFIFRAFAIKKIDNCLGCDLPIGKDRPNQPPQNKQR